MQALEWGSGRSTLWWARHVQHLVSVEQDEGWHAIISSRLREQGIANVDYRFIPVDASLPCDDRQIFSTLPPYVKVVDDHADDSLDLVVVDGHYRQACIRAVLSKIKPGGYLLVDNFNWLPESRWEIPVEWVKVCDSSNALTQTVVWQKPGKA
jgi:predicted O-methyltransferase YrrM